MAVAAGRTAGGRMMRFALAGLGLTGMAAVILFSAASYDPAEVLPLSTRPPAAAASVTWALAVEQANYQRDVEYQLAVYLQRLERLRREAADATPQAREALQLEPVIADLAGRIAETQTALDQLRQSGEGTWLTRRIATEEALQSLRRADVAGWAYRHLKTALTARSGSDISPRYS